MILDWAILELKDALARLLNVELLVRTLHAVRVVQVAFVLIKQRLLVLERLAEAADFLRRPSHVQQLLIDVRWTLLHQVLRRLIRPRHAQDLRIGLGVWFSVWYRSRVVQLAIVNNYSAAAVVRLLLSMLLMVSLATMISLIFHFLSVMVVLVE